MPQNTGDGLPTTPSDVHAQSECHCALYNNYYINNHNRNHVLLYYLFQENKSFGSKTPFAFILWCTGSCVEHINTVIHSFQHQCPAAYCYALSQVKYVTTFRKLLRRLSKMRLQHSYNSRLKLMVKHRICTTYSYVRNMQYTYLLLCMHRAYTKHANAEFRQPTYCLVPTYVKLKLK